MGPCRQCHLPLVLSIYGEYIIYLDQRDNSTNVMIFLANESILNAVGLKLKVPKMEERKVIISIYRYMELQLTKFCLIGYFFT